MQQHYGFDDETFASLVSAGITIADLFRAVGMFDPVNCGSEISRVCLYHYIDKMGDFNKPPKLTKHKLIAKAVFKTHFKTPKEQLAVLEYIEAIENKEF